MAHCLNQTYTKVFDQVRKSKIVLPARYELYSIELLKQVAELLIHIRGNAFAKDWTLKFESRQ